MKAKLPCLVLVAVLLLPGARLAAQSRSAGAVDSNGSRKFNLDWLVEGMRAESAEDAARNHAAHLSAVLYDRNHDGKLDSWEFAAWEKEVHAAMEKNPRVLKKYDKNRDKKLDEAEWAVFMKDLLGG